VQESSQRFAIVAFGLLGHAGIRRLIEAVIRPRVHVKLNRNSGTAQAIRIGHVGHWVAVPTYAGSGIYAYVGRIDIFQQQVGIDLREVFPAKPEMGPGSDRWTWDAFLVTAEKCAKAGVPFGLPISHCDDALGWLGVLFRPKGRFTYYFPWLRGVWSFSSNKSGAFELIEWFNQRERAEQICTEEHDYRAELVPLSRSPLSIVLASNPSLDPTDLSRGVQNTMEMTSTPRRSGRGGQPVTIQNRDSARIVAKVRRPALTNRCHYDIPHGAAKLVPRSAGTDGSAPRSRGQ
jgi:hypothetical protein